MNLADIAADMEPRASDPETPGKVKKCSIKKYFTFRCVTVGTMFIFAVIVLLSVLYIFRNRILDFGTSIIAWIDKKKWIGIPLFAISFIFG